MPEGKVVAVCLKAEPGLPKLPVESIELVAGMGVGGSVTGVGVGGVSVAATTGGVEGSCLRYCAAMNA